MKDIEINTITFSRVYEVMTSNEFSIEWIVKKKLVLPLPEESWHWVLAYDLVKRDSQALTYWFAKQIPSKAILDETLKNPNKPRSLFSKLLEDLSLEKLLKLTVDLEKINSAKGLVLAGARVSGSGLIDYAISHNDDQLIHFIAQKSQAVDFSLPDKGTLSPIELATSQFYHNYYVIEALIDNGAKLQFKNTHVDLLTLVMEMRIFKNGAIYQKCPNKNIYNPLEEIASQVYSGNPAITLPNVYNKVLELLKSDVISEIIHVTTLEPAPILIKRSSPFNNDGSDGVTNAISKSIVIAPANTDWSQSTFAHELSHKMMIQIFNNNANPYGVYGNEDKELYHLTIAKTLDNIAYFVFELISTSDNYGAGIDLSALTTYERGKILNGLFSNKKLMAHKDLCVETVISFFLKVYDYLVFQEDQEFIVRYPAAIAAGCYEGHNEVKAMLEPVEKYWNEIIKPQIAKYSELHDESDQCMLYQLFQ